MNIIGLTELSMENLANYGVFHNMINPVGTPSIGDEPIQFFRDIVQANYGVGMPVSFSICRTMRRKYVIEVAEYHNHTCEGILPLDGDVLVHLAIPTAGDQPPVEDFIAVLVPKGTMLVLKPGVWHHAPFAYEADCVNTMIVLPERTYFNDCIVRNLKPEEYIQIQV